MTHHALAGSARGIMAGATRLGPVHADERLEATLVLRGQAPEMLRERLAELTHGGKPAPLSRENFAATHGATPADIAAVEHFALAHGLKMVAASAARRTVILSGLARDFCAAFNIALHHYAHATGVYRGREGALHLPAALQGIVQAVLGLDNRPQARAQFRRIRHARTAALSYTPTTLATLYGFPAATGSGQSIALIELGGGSTAADITAYFSGLGLPAPKIVTVAVDQATNQATGSPDGPDGEVMLDIEVAGAIAPEATIILYFAPNTDAGFLNAVTTAIHDTTNKPDILSISWGGGESSWTAQAMTQFDQAFQDAATLGLTVCVAAGDNGSSDGGAGDNVDFPASSPHVLACGGTSLRASGGKITAETVWNDGAQGGATGGGISTVFAVPAWQQGLSATLTAGGTTALTHRGLPDVAGDADPETGYQVRVDGTDTVIGGTSAVAPLWAGLIARLNQLGAANLGLIQPKLYANASTCNDIAKGNNGTYAAAPGWDACTGLGSPSGAALARLFAGGIV